MRQKDQLHHWRVADSLKRWLRKPYSILVLLLGILTLLLSGCLALVFWETYQMRRRNKREQEQTLLHHSGWMSEGRHCTPEHWSRSYHLVFASFIETAPVLIALIQHTETKYYHLLIQAEWAEDSTDSQCPVQDIYRIKVGDSYGIFVFLDTPGPNEFQTCELARKAVEALTMSSPVFLHTKKTPEKREILYHSGWMSEGRHCTPEHWSRSYHLAFVSFIETASVLIALIQHTEMKYYHLLIQAEWSDSHCPVQDIYRVWVGDSYGIFVFLDTPGPNEFLTCEQARKAVETLTVSSPVFLSSNE